jgi:hypothetical protein
MPKLPIGNDGYNFKKSNAKINIVIIIKPIFTLLTIYVYKDLCAKEINLLYK